MGKLYNLAKAVADGNEEAIKKAATSFEVGGTLTPRNAINNFNSVSKNADIFNKIRLVPLYENTAKLSDVITKPVHTGRAGAVTARAALDGGTDIASITKDNIGNSVTAKEHYLLFNLNFDEIANMARTSLDGAGDFNKQIAGQFATGSADIFEELMWTGDNGVTEPYGFETNAKANLASGAQSVTDPIKTVRNVNTNGVTSFITILDSLWDVTRIAVRKKGVFFMNTADAYKYAREVKATSSESGNGWITKDSKKILAYEGKEIIDTPYITEGTIMFCPLENMCKCINVKKFMTATEEMKIPVNLVYSMAMFWNLQFITFDQVSIAYDQGE